MTLPNTLKHSNQPLLKSNTQVLPFDNPALCRVFLDQNLPICYNLDIQSKKEDKMKVKELIELLSKFDQESELRGSYNGGEYESVLDFLKVEEVDGKVWLLD